MGIKDKRDIASGIYDQNSSSPRGRSTRPPTVVAQFQVWTFFYLTLRSAFFTQRFLCAQKKPEAQRNAL